MGDLMAGTSAVAGAPAAVAPPGSPPEPERASASARAVRVSALVVLGAALVLGSVLRFWLLVHRPLNADEAVAGLIAHQILHGHFSAFFWGQSFGGVEPYLVAPFIAVGGQNTMSLELAPVVLSAVAALLVWRIARRLVRDRLLAALAGGLAWAAPLPFVYQSTYEGGYRGVTLVCGLAAWLFCLRVLDGRTSVWEFAALGAFFGLGWWALPEIVYFVVPAAAWLAAAVRRRPPHGAPFWLGRFATAGAAAALASLPWLWANVGSGFASLSASSFPGAGSAANPGFGGRLKIFFQAALPLELGLRDLITGRWTDGRAGMVLAVVVLAVVVAVVVLCFVRAGRALALGLGVVAFPLLAALQPGTWAWQDGRYLVYLGPLLALAAAVAAEEAARLVRRRSRRPDVRDVGRLLLSVFVAAALLLTVGDFVASVGVSGGQYFGDGPYSADWANPDQPSTTAAAALLRDGIRAGFASYWVAYKLDYLTGERLQLTVVPPDPDRWPSLTGRVLAARHPVWLFIATDTGRPAEQFGATPSIEGPGDLTESSFVARLDRLGVGYRVRRVAMFEVVAPDRRVTPGELAASGT